MVPIPVTRVNTLNRLEKILQIHESFQEVLIGPTDMGNDRGSLYKIVLKSPDSATGHNALRSLAPCPKAGPHEKRHSQTANAVSD